MINKDWIKQLGEFSQKVEEDLESVHQKKEIKNINKIVFENHYEYIKFTIDFMEEIAKKENKLKVTFHYRHAPYPNVLSKEDILKLKPIMPKIKWTILSKCSTPSDLWHAKLWEKIGVQVKTGADVLADRLIIINNYIINAYVPKEAIVKWDNSYSANKASDFNMTETMEAISNKKYRTIVTIFEDKEIAQLLHQ